MKKALLFCTLPLCLMLTACGNHKAPLKTDTGESWNTAWTTVGNFLGAEVPENFKEIRNEGFVTSAQTSYVVWAKGEPQTYTNSEDTKITTYDAQIHLLLEEDQSSDEAQKRAAEWDAIAASRYDYQKEWTEELSDQTFTLTEYKFPEDGGPESYGASATGVHGTYAIHVDVTSLSAEDAGTILTDFLSDLHYAEK